jgi:CheY-like chemotaxis protein
VVEDQEICISSILQLLQKCGVNIQQDVNVCINGKEALQKVKIKSADQEFYDLILMDFSMPILNGVEATKLIIKHLDSIGTQKKDIPVIIGVTGHVED